jgi:hypothetical protein
MISTFIVLASLLLAGVFIAAWLLKPDFRRRVEAPKHLFAEQVRQYDEQNDSARENTPDAR